MTRRLLAGPFAALGLLLAPLSVARAQCPDGTPPPCAGSRPAARITPPAASERARHFLLLPFRNVTRQPDQDWLVEGSTTMLADALGRWQGITVVSDERLYPALKRAGIVPGNVVELPRVRRVAEETGGWTAVTGDIIATGGRIRISARAFDVPTNRELVRAAGDVPAGGDVRAAYDSVSLRLLHSVGLDAASMDLATATTRDLDAYRAYLRGLGRLRHAELRPALADFEEAVRRDSTFALAWAHLATTALNTETAAIFNPESRAVRAAARAVSLSQRLPPRHRQLVQAIDAGLHVQFAECRRLLASLLAADSNDVEALTQQVGLEMFDPVLVGPPGHQRPRGSYNVGARLSKRIVELDPDRHVVYGLLAGIYAGAGLPGSSPSFGITREPTSVQDLMGLVQRRQDVRGFEVVLRDTIELVPAESLSAIPKDTLNAMRRTARAIGRSWAERWVNVAPDESAGHQLLSELLGYDADYPGALRQLAVAESLGIQIPAYVPQARRVLLLGKAGQLVEAGRLADSLTRAGFFANPSNLINNRDAASWAFLLHLLQGRLAQAATVFDNSVQLARLVSPSAPPASVPMGGLRTVMGNADPEDEPRIPKALRAQQLDSLLRRATDLAANEQLSPWLPIIVPAVAEFAGQEKTRTPAILAAADAIAAAGKPHLAWELATNQLQSDSAAEPEAARRAWFRDGAEALNAVRTPLQARFHPLAASVSADGATFEFRVDGDAPFLWNMAQTPSGNREYSWNATVEAAGRYYRFQAGSLARPAAVSPDSGTLGDVLGPLAPRTAYTGAIGAGGTYTDTTLLQSVNVRTDIAPGVLRLVVTDPTIVAWLRREHPAQARLRFRPCVKPLGSAEQCVDERVTIAYP